MINENDLPKLKKKQHECIKRFLINGYNKIDAFRFAYDCSNMSKSASYVEASRFFKNPKITLWIEFYEQNQQESVKEELKYSALDFFDECNELKDIALSCRDKFGNPNIQAAIKATENKAKVCGLLKDQIINNSGPVTQMPSVVIDGKTLELKVGESVDEHTDTANA